MAPLITKDELTKKLSIVTRQLEISNKKDEDIREEFAKAFGWKAERWLYSGESTNRIPSWIEVFTELGRLMSYDVRRKKDEEIAKLREALDAIKEENEKDEVFSSLLNKRYEKR